MTQASTPAPQPGPWQAAIQASLSRGVGVDQVEEVDYENGGHFTHRLRVTGGVGPDNVVVLQDGDLRQLLSDLHTEIGNAPAGVDLAGLAVFADLIEDALHDQPASTRFENARFGAVSQDETRGILYGHLGLGVDVAGTVRDARGAISFEQHVVMLPPGPYRPLSRADRESLVNAITANPPSDQLWQRILGDARATPAPAAAGGTGAAVPSGTSQS